MGKQYIEFHTQGHTPFNNVFNAHAPIHFSVPHLEMLNPQQAKTFLSQENTKGCVVVL